MDFELLSRELVRALRGKRSQGATNKRLRRTSNALHAWERGTRAPSSTDFFRLSALAGVEPSGALSRFGHPPHADVARSLPALAEWLRSLAREQPRTELSRRLRRSRNTVARWLDGVTEPRLPDLLGFVSVTTLRLLDFVAVFVDPAQVPSIADAHRDLALQKRLAYEMPWAHAVLRVLELRAYRALPAHERGFIARHIGVAPNEEEQCLAALARSGQIYVRRGKWRVRRVLAVDTRDDPRGNLALKEHWADVALGRLRGEATESGALFSYNVFAISEEGLEEIRRAHLDYFAKLRSIVAECRDATRLVLANVQLVPLDISRDASSSALMARSSRDGLLPLGYSSIPSSRSRRKNVG